MTKYQYRLRCLDINCGYKTKPQEGDGDFYIHKMHQDTVKERRAIGEWEPCA